MQVNFTEAALLLQGTASVYSKKVEFLYQNVLKMLHLLASQKALDEADSQDGMGTLKQICVQWTPYFYKYIHIFIWTINY